MQRAVVGFYQDEEGHWAARLECGHGQHVRHDPPWMVREWVISEEGRAARIGRLMECKLCDEEWRWLAGRGCWRRVFRRAGVMGRGTTLCGVWRMWAAF